MHPTDHHRRQQDRLQQPKAPLEWEPKARRADDFIAPNVPLEWEDEPEPQHQPESQN